MQEQTQEHQRIVGLLSAAKTLSSALNHAMKEEKNLEEDFFRQNKGKNIVLITDKEEVTGELQDINRFRIEVKTSEGIKYFCKTGLIGFYANSSKG